MGFGRDARDGIFRKVETFSQVEVNHFGAASLITRNTNDVTQVQQVLLLALTMMITAPMMVIGGVIMALRQDVPLTGILIVVLPIMLIVIGLVMSRAIPLFQVMQKKIDRINLVMRETLSGVRVIRAFVRTRHEEARFDEASHDLMDTALRVNRLFAITLPTIMLIMNLSTVAVIFLGAFRVDAGAMPIGNLTAFMQYIWGFDQLEGWVGIDQWCPDNPRMHLFHQRFVERYGEDPWMWPNAIPGLHRYWRSAFTEQIDELMAVADLVVSKPGGLTTSAHFFWQRSNDEELFRERVRRPPARGGLLARRCRLRRTCRQRCPRRGAAGVGGGVRGYRRAHFLLRQCRDALCHRAVQDAGLHRTMGRDRP